MEKWWRRWTTCEVCNRRFRKGTGGGITGTLVCSDECWGLAWADWVRPGSVDMIIDAKRMQAIDLRGERVHR